MLTIACILFFVNGHTHNMDNVEFGTLKKSKKNGQHLQGKQSVVVMIGLRDFLSYFSLTKSIDINPYLDIYYYYRHYYPRIINIFWWISLSAGCCPPPEENTGQVLPEFNQIVKKMPIWIYGWIKIVQVFRTKTILYFRSINFHFFPLSLRIYFSQVEFRLMIYKLLAVVIYYIYPLKFIFKSTKTYICSLKSTDLLVFKDF